MLNRFVALETDFSKEVEAEKSEYHDPDGKVYLSVKDTPMICLVGDAEELQTKRYLDESKHNLY